VKAAPEPWAEWLTFGALSRDHLVSCIDGRATHPVVGTPGGSFGELLLLLAAVEGQRPGAPLGEDELEGFLSAYLDRLGGLYLHTDEAALGRLSGALPGGFDPEAAPELAHRPAALEALCQPAHLGCGHLKLAATQPQTYQVRPGLLQALLQSFFRRRWSGDPRLHLEVLAGAHEEVAVAVVEGAPSLEDEARLPALVPLGDQSRFVYHPEAARFLRRRGAALAAELLPGLDAESLFSAVEALGQAQLAATVAALAPTLPTEHLRYEGEASS